MEQKHRDIIEENMEKLVSLTNFDSILQLVLNYHKNLFLENQLKEFQSQDFRQKGEIEKCRIFYKTIQTRGPKAYSSLLKILDDSNHDVLYRLLCNPDRSSSAPGMKKIVVKKSRSLPNDPMAYKMTSYPRGRYLIINNIKFDDEALFRNGAHSDVSLDETLSEMGFIGEYFVDKTVQEMKKLLFEFSTNASLADVDSCVVALMSHGTVDDCGYDCIKGKDSLLLRRHDVLRIFNEESCKLRKGCPKIFIIQTCRGDGEADKRGGVSKRSKVADIQNPWRDTILLTPCVEGMKSNRDRIEGTWFIQDLVNVLQNYAHSHSLDQMASMVNEQFDRRFHEIGAITHQVQCYIEYGVSKKLYFNPGLY